MLVVLAAELDWFHLNKARVAFMLPLAASGKLLRNFTRFQRRCLKTANEKKEKKKTFLFLFPRAYVAGMRVV